MIILFVVKVAGREFFAAPSRSIDPAILSYTGTVAQAFAFQSEALAADFAERHLPFNPTLKNYEIKRIIEITFC